MSIQLEEGSIIEGKVTKIKPFGALVELPGNIQGLVHISHISSAYVQNVAEYVNIGDTVKVKVLSVDMENNKVSLSIKDAQPPVPKEARSFQPRKDNFNGGFDNKGNTKQYDNSRSYGNKPYGNKTFENKSYENKPHDSKFQDNRASEERNKVLSTDSNAVFEEKFKEYVKLSNERLAGLNKRNKKR